MSLMDVFQTIVAPIPSHLKVEGALLLEMNSTSKQNIWQWTLTKPTSLRTDPLYSKVGNIKLNNIRYCNGIMTFQVSTSASILLSLIPFLIIIFFNLLIYRRIKESTSLLPYSTNRNRRETSVATSLMLIIMVYVACHGIITCINVIELVEILTGKNKKLNN